MSAVRALTDETSVIASNFGICGLDNCSQDDYRRLFIPAIGQRNTFAVALSSRDLSSVVLARLTLILDIATKPDRQIANQLAQAGVTHYLLAFDKERPVNTNEIQGNQIKMIFQNEAFALFRIESSHQ
jgi:hypothetical protein